MKSLRHDIHFAGRGALADAGELIERFGAHAESEAALRAANSRNLGNVIHYCRWRQVERMIAMLREPRPSGAIH